MCGITLAPRRGVRNLARGQREARNPWDFGLIRSSHPEWGARRTSLNVDQACRAMRPTPGYRPCTAPRCQLVSVSKLVNFGGGVAVGALYERAFLVESTNYARS